MKPSIKYSDIQGNDPRGSVRQLKSASGGSTETFEKTLWSRGKNNHGGTKQHIKFLFGSSLLIAILASGCSKSFFNRPPENELTVGTYYQTVAQVQASTDILYAAPWFGLNGKAFLAIGDLASGNAFCYSGTDGAFDAFANLSEGNATQEVQSAWDAEYTVIAQANELLINLPGAATNVPAAAVNNALGEAHLMRAMAYFYLVRQYGNVPIITNPTNDANTFTTVPTNPVTDVYKFIVNDMRFAVANCTPGVANTGHASSNSAAGALAKVYLYEQNYDSARYFAEMAINSGEFSLVGLNGVAGTYTSMFELSGNNCAESMIALQWTSNAGYGFGNQLQSVIAANTTITGTGDGYGELGPSWDLQDAFVADGDTAIYPNINGRRHGILMMPGDFYPELQKAAGGYAVPLSINEQGMHAGMKKYVVGDPDDNNGLAAKQATSNNTYLLRLADVYLIEAEAILGQSSGVAPGTGIPLTATCSDPTALKYVNLVRQRAGLAAWTSFTYQQLLNERRLEMAIEGDYWYDLCRLDGFNNQSHPVAISIISGQDRGSSSGPGTAANNYTDYTRVPVYITPTNSQFLLPVPSSESTVDPALLAAPVPYNFQ